MTWIAPLETLPSSEIDAIGGKGAALHRLAANHLPIPKTLCITTQAYQDFFDGAGLREKVHLELNRKIFSAVPHARRDGSCFCACHITGLW